MRGAAFFAGAAAALAAGAVAQAQTTPAERAREAAAMLAAAGFQVRANDIQNPCGRSVRPKPAAVDFDGDGRPEAVITDVDAACYGGAGDAFVIIQRQGPAQWMRVGAAYGRLKLLETRTNGWRDWSLEGPGCQRTWTWQPGQGYISLKPCPGGAPAGKAAAAPAKAPAPGGDERAAIFRAAGFTPTRGKYLMCDKSQELALEVRDLNGDGRPDAIVTDGGAECFGNTGAGYVLVTKDANGAWRKLYQSIGIPEFQTTRGVGGWPDVINGGPGFCFAVQRWNGSDYTVIRWKEESPGACKGRR